MKLQVVIVEPFDSFKQKIRITKKYSEDNLEILDKVVYIERWEKEI